MVEPPEHRGVAGLVLRKLSQGGGEVGRDRAVAEQRRQGGGGQVLLEEADQLVLQEPNELVVAGLLGGREAREDRVMRKRRERRARKKPGVVNIGGAELNALDSGAAGGGVSVDPLDRQRAGGGER